MKNHFMAAILQRRSAILLASCLALLFTLTLAGTAQTETTGAIEGKVVNSKNEPLKGAVVRFTNDQTGVPISRRTNDEGKFYLSLLQPGVYTISISAPGFKTRESQQRVMATEVTKVMPYPTMLEPETAARP